MANKNAVKLKGYYDHEMIGSNYENVWRPLDVTKILSFDCEREGLSNSHLLKDVRVIILELRQADDCPWEPIGDEEYLAVGRLYASILRSLISENDHVFLFNVAGLTWEYDEVTGKLKTVRGVEDIVKDYFVPNGIENFFTVKVPDDDFTEGYEEYLIFECPNERLPDILAENWSRGVECYVFKHGKESMARELVRKVPADAQAMKKLVDNTKLSFEVIGEGEAIRILTKELSLQSFLPILTCEYIQNQLRLLSKV